MASAFPESPLPGAHLTGAPIRPEVIQLGPSPAESVNRFDGLLHDTIYLGESAQHVVNIGPGTSREGSALKVLELIPRYVARDDARESVKVWFRAEDAVILPQT